MPHTTHSPYGSARDLPSFQEMERFVQGAKALTLFVARDKRAELIQVEQKLHELADVVDRFYERLGSRNWVFHDSLNVSRVAEILDETSEPEETERRFIEPLSRRRHLRILAHAPAER